MRNRPSIPSLVALVCLAITSCAPGGTAGGEPGASPARTTPKRIIGAIQSDPSVLTNTLVISSGQPGVPEIEEMVHVGLTDNDPEGVRHAFLAEAVPTLENNLWKVLPDGKMETTWTLKAGVAWHDGTPVTVSDLLFTLDFARDRQFIEFNNRKLVSLTGAEAVDARTITVRWDAPMIDADALFTRSLASILPRHILESQMQDDKLGYREWPYWTGEFVGTGPYKIKEFIRGDHLTLVANDNYVMGRPKIDEIEVKFIPDSNTRMANVLANAVDLTIGRDVALDQAVQAKDQWKDGRAETYTGSWFGIHPQLLNYSPAIVGNVQFRQALLHAIDRQNMVDTVLYGMSSVPHAWLAPAEGQYWDIHDKVPHYDYDPRRAEQMVADLGFTKRDGFFHDATGQKLSVELRTTGDNSSHVKGIFPIADYWQRIGVATEPVVIPVQRQQDAEYRATFPGFQALRGAAGTSAMAAVVSSRAGLPENNFRASGNYSRLMDPEYEALYERFTRTISQAERKALVEQAIRFFAEQQIKLGIFYDAASTMINNRLLNVQARRVAWNSYLWDVK